jgi:hypothetical protein
VADILAAEEYLRPLVTICFVVDDVMQSFINDSVLYPGIYRQA